ncbi:hypothetical protein [Pseudoroseomonas cervicalis]|uniref:hypothetical protein n=1 Tax=Teichococcus cervicalis TaxID=204525 RepID=UPI0022F14F47|nr:hypothetical protein [Pseudoroseomonas cervicalis]WBV42122.1 hypothetical protein PFY06_12870 [Pseudoroseomonas cervicalis]
MRRDPGPTLPMLLAAPGRPDRLRLLAARLRDLAAWDETPARREEVALALAQPRWGLRVLALRVLAAWGGPRHKAWLVARADRALPLHQGRRSPPGSATRWQALEIVTARRLLPPLLDRTDAGWVFDRYLSAWRDGADLLPLLQRLLCLLPADWVEARLDAAMARPDEQEALLWLAFHLRGLPARQAWLTRFAAGPDAALAEQARRALRVG